MNINACYPSKNLKAADFEEDTTYTISHVAMETVGQGKDAETKPVVYFEETDKGLVLNKTNANTIAQLHGPDTDGWTGKQITMFATEVEFAGSQTLAIRVRLRAPKGPTKAAAVGTKPSNAAPAGGGSASGGTKAATWAAYIAKVDAYAQEDGAEPYSDQEKQEVFRKLMANTFPGKTAAQLTPEQWAQAQASIESDFNAATRDFLPF